MERDDLEDFLRTAPIIEQGPLHKGGGHPDKLIGLLDGGIGLVMKLAVPGDPVKYHQMCAECAAPVLARALGWDDLVPATVMRVAKDPTSNQYVVASVQVAWPLFRPAAELIRDASTCPDAEIWRVAIFDALALNTDRHGANWGFVEGMDDRPKLIDHGHAFDASTSGAFDFINLKQGQQIPTDLVDLVKARLVDPGPPAGLEELRPANTVQRIMDRAQLFVQTGQLVV